jgi:hypothetical protein
VENRDSSAAELAEPWDFLDQRLRDGAKGCYLFHLRHFAKGHRNLLSGPPEEALAAQHQGIFFVDVVFTGRLEAAEVVEIFIHFVIDFVRM